MLPIVGVNCISVPILFMIILNIGSISVNQIIHHKFEKKHKRKVERVIFEKHINESQYS
jgi:hypothetical protein